MQAAKDGKKPRLFIIDHWVMSSYWETAKKDGADKEVGVQHACRALFYLRK